MATYTELLNDTAETGDEAATLAVADTQEQEQESQDSPEDLPESPKTPESPAVTEQKQVPLKALEAERRRRQSTEQQVQAQQRQIDMLIETLKAQQPKTPATAPAVPDFLTENDRWQQYLFDSIGRLLNEREQRAWTEKAQATEEEMRDDHPDYDNLVDQYFKPAAQHDPSLQQKLRMAANPAKFAYRTAKRLQTEAELGGEFDLDKIRAKAKADARAEVLAELQGKKAELEEKVKIPVSLGSAGTSAPTATEKIPDGGSYRASELY